MRDFTHKHATALFALILATAAAHAQEKSCIELTTKAEAVEEYVNEQGQKSTRLSEVSRVVPGAEIVWTITAKNVCTTPAEDVVVANPVPAEMTYVADSAMGVGTEITYSLDSKEFKPAHALIVRESDGSSRAARAEDIRAIRWTYAAPFAPGATAFVRYRAIVK